MTESNAKQQLMSVLFDGSVKLINIKFFPGVGGPVAEETLCAEVLSAVEQHRNGTASVSETFADPVYKTDVRVFATGL